MDMGDRIYDKLKRRVPHLSRDDFDMIIALARCTTEAEANDVISKMETNRHAKTKFIGDGGQRTAGWK